MEILLISNLPASCSVFFIGLTLGEKNYNLCHPPYSKKGIKILILLINFGKCISKVW